MNCSWLRLRFRIVENKNNAVCRSVYQKSKQHAPKGQKHIAQGTALGKSIANTNAPCRGKSVNYQCFCSYRAFRFYQSVHPRRCLGLCAFWAFSPSSLITIQDCTIQNRRRSREQFKTQNSKFLIRFAKYRPSSKKVLQTKK